jgi:hypothetical protein
MLGGVAAFMAVVATVYTLAGGEPAGIAMLAGAALLAVMVAAFLLRTPYDPDPDPRPGVVGEFSVASVWPLLTGLAAAVAATGLAWGPFPVVVGGALLAAALAGLLGETWRV